MPASISCGEANYPPALDRAPGWPVSRSVTFIGPYHDFRRMVWRSLRDFDGVYEFMDAYRLIEIHFDRDETYASVRELARCHLLIIALGVSELPNNYLGPVVAQAITLRKNAALPTWVYSPMTLDRVRVVYTPELADLLTSMDIGARALAEAAPAPPSTAPAAPAQTTARPAKGKAAKPALASASVF